MSEEVATPSLLKLHGHLDMPDFSADIFTAQLVLEVCETWQVALLSRIFINFGTHDLIVGRYQQSLNLKFHDMNSQMRTNLLLTILISTLGNMLFWLLTNSLEVWFTEPRLKSDYLTFYLTFCFAAATIGSLLVANSPNHRFWKVGLSVLLLLTISTIIIGMFYTSYFRSEEFLLYFLAIQLVWLVFLTNLGIYLRYFIQSNLTRKQKNVVIVSGMLWLFVMNSLIIIGTRVIISAYDLLIFVPIILALMLWVSFKAEKSYESEQLDQPSKILSPRIKKNLRTVVIALTIPISIFLIVYANVQTELAKEQEAIANQLLTESQYLNETAQHEVLELREELTKCQGELNQLKAGNKR